MSWEEEESPNGLVEIANKPTQIENELMGYLKDQWGKRCAISLAGINVPFDPTKSRRGFEDKKSYLVPRIENISSEWLEYPASAGVRRHHYQFLFNIVTSPNLGLGQVQKHAERLREIFELKSLVLGEASLDFEILKVRSGFSTPQGEWEALCSILFTVLLKAPNANE
jgi:hypothetical protein